MLPVGIRNASIINARKTKASMKAVINHSRVFAISATLSFRGLLSEPLFLLLLIDTYTGNTVRLAAVKSVEPIEH
jgi:hypothetical protein